MIDNKSYIYETRFEYIDFFLTVILCEKVFYFSLSLSFKYRDLYYPM